MPWSVVPSRVYRVFPAPDCGDLNIWGQAPTSDFPVLIHFNSFVGVSTGKCLHNSRDFTVNEPKIIMLTRHHFYMNVGPKGQGKNVVNFMIADKQEI